MLGEQRHSYHSSLMLFAMLHHCCFKAQSFCRPKPLHSTFNYKADQFGRPMSKVLLTDFFGDQRRIAAKRNKAVQPQCRAESNTVNALNASNVTWQEPAVISDQMLEPDVSDDWLQTQHQLAKQHCLGKQDILMLLCLSVVAFLTCTLLGKSKLASAKQVKLFA